MYVTETNVHLWLTLKNGQLHIGQQSTCCSHWTTIHMLFTLDNNPKSTCCSHWTTMYPKKTGVKRRGFLIQAVPRDLFRAYLEGVE
ncbi:hypothetical protein CEXT_648251 [Caerostris extrusa]|uniref:Uncharacterized protein n=1 Tax=Caerostris extrusa TaxID=172846 RepID=A0AAV4XBU4_CAEEX|nr:hypothetical protein CEXT_648251 [Caerostris extrusa]